MSTRPTPARRFAALASLTALAVVAAPTSAGAAAESKVEVVNTETVQVYTDATGKVETKRVYEQLTMTGSGAVELVNPIETDGLRNLDEFGGFEVRDGQQIFETTVEGNEQLRTVSNYGGDLPLEVSVEYLLDGEAVEPGDVVGESGVLEVNYTVRNVTSAPQEVSFPDGSGGTVTKTVDVPIPLVGSLTTTAPANFSDVQSEGANMAGDGKGGTKLSYTMTLFPPIGTDTAEFGYTATITDGVVPRTDIAVLPVNPLNVPTFKNAASSYQGGADTGARLAEGAGTIDENLLKLRDGAGELLAGLLKLQAGAEELSAGLTGRAAPGSTELADGAGQLSDGMTKASTGSQELSDGLGLISGGLDQLADANKGLPAAQDGIRQLKDGVDLIISRVGSVSEPTTLIGGLATLEAGLVEARDGSGQLTEGLQVLTGNRPAESAGLKGARMGASLVKGGLDNTLAEGGSLDRLDGGLKVLDLGFCPMTGGVAVPTPAGNLTCDQVVTQLQQGAQQSRLSLSTAAGVLGQIVGGLDTAIAGLEDRLIPGMQDLQAGLGRAVVGSTKLKNGAIELKGGLGQVSGGLTQLNTGVASAVQGVFKLANGANDAYAGSQELSSGMVQLDDGAGRLADGSDELATGLGEAGDGSELLADGTGQAADGAPKLVDGAQRLSDEGTKKLVEAGKDTTQEYGELYATIAAGAERADADGMAFGAPEGATGLTAYSYVIQGEDGEGNRNLARGLSGLVLLGAGAGAFALRRRFI